MNNTNQYNSTKPLFKVTQIVNYLLWILEVLLALRFVLKLTGANPGAEFTDLVYAITQPFVAPFLAVFPISVVQGNIFEWTTLLAIFVYWLIAVAIIRLLLVGRTVSEGEAAERLREEERKRTGVSGKNK